MSHKPTRRFVFPLLLMALIAPQWSCATSRTRADPSSRDALDPSGGAPPAPTARDGRTPAPPPPAPPAPAPAAPAPLAHAAGAPATTQSTASAPAPAPELELRILFVGNSYTFYNGGVDAVLTALARSRGRHVLCESVTAGGKTLQWHWEEGNARAAIARGGWDYVVLQELSTRPVTDPERMHEFVRKFDVEIKQNRAKTVLFLTWARFHQPENQLVITRACNTIADELGATVARVGVAWERVIRENPRIQLHTDDRSHPTPAGTYLAACVFYATLLGDTPEGLPASVQTASGRTLEIDPADARILQRAAATVSSPMARPSPSGARER